MQINLQSEAILDTVRMQDALAGLADKRGKITRMLESGELISLRRGLYAGRRDLDPHCLAGPIYGPSYLSFETALAWHGMIPEGVTEMLSATVKRTTRFRNHFGNYRYLTVPKPVYPIGVLLITGSDLPFLAASPTKALIDRIARESGFRSMADVARWLDGMRVDLGSGLDRHELTECAEHYGRPAVRWLLRYAEKHQLTRP
jgi:hypothetical protein